MKLESFFKYFMVFFAVSAVVGLGLYVLLGAILWKILTGMDAPHHGP